VLSKVLVQVAVIRDIHPNPIFREAAQQKIAKRGTEQNQAPCSQAYTSYAWMNRMAKDKMASSS
jgi:hypothetical protein